MLALAQDAAHPGHPRIVVEQQPGGVGALLAQPRRASLGVDDHRPELVEVKATLAAANPLLRKEDRAPRDVSLTANAATSITGRVSSSAPTRAKRRRRA